MKGLKEKLSLNKKTIADMETQEMKKAVAGVGVTYWTCPTGPPMDCKDPSVADC